MNLREEMPERAGTRALSVDRRRVVSSGAVRDTQWVIYEVDTALRTLIERETGMRDVDVVFDAPTREWAGRRTVPTVDVYLYDIREDLRRRERGVLNEYNEDQTRIVGRHLPPRHLQAVLPGHGVDSAARGRAPAAVGPARGVPAVRRAPADLLSGPLAEIGLPVPLTVGLPPPEDRGFADVWSALGGELKPSIDVVVIAPVNTGQQYPLGPPVTSVPRFNFGGSGGFPANESVAISFDHSSAQPADPGDGRASADEGVASAGRDDLPEAMTRAGEPAQRIGGSSPRDPSRVSMRRRRLIIKRNS